jgi:hypothetical protein
MISDVEINHTVRLYVFYELNFYNSCISVPVQYFILKLMYRPIAY